jgi:hypothetical protein
MIWPRLRMTGLSSGRIEEVMQQGSKKHLPDLCSIPESIAAGPQKRESRNDADSDKSRSKATDPTQWPLASGSSVGRNIG